MIDNNEIDAVIENYKINYEKFCIEMEDPQLFEELFDLWVKNWISEDLLSNEYFAFKALELTNLFYDKFDISIKNDIAFNVKALTQYPFIVHQISNEIIQNDSIQQLIIKYISLDGNLIRLLNSENRKNQDIVLNAIESSEYGYKYADISLQHNVEFAEKACTLNGMVLHFFPVKLLENRMLNMIAVKQDPIALKYVHPDFKSDIEIVCAAISKNINSLVYSDIKIWQHKDILLLAKQSNSDYIQSLYTKFLNIEL